MAKIKLTESKLMEMVKGIVEEEVLKSKVSNAFDTDAEAVFEEIKSILPNAQLVQSGEKYVYGIQAKVSKSDFESLLEKSPYEPRYRGNFDDELPEAKSVGKYLINKVGKLVVPSAIFKYGGVDDQEFEIAKSKLDDPEDYFEDEVYELLPDPFTLIIGFSFFQKVLKKDTQYVISKSIVNIREVQTILMRLVKGKELKLSVSTAFDDFVNKLENIS
jgi:hypothetical protein